MTNCFKLLTAAFIVSLAQSQGATPLPGAIIGSINVKSINNILGLFVPLTSQYTLDNATFHLNQSISGTGYKLELRTIHLEPVTWGPVTLIYKDANTLRLQLTGININAEIDSTAYILYFIPTSTKYFNITNLTAVLEFKTSSSDNVHWQLQGISQFTLDDFYLEMESSFLNYWAQTFHGLVVQAAQKIITYVSDYFDAAV